MKWGWGGAQGLPPCFWRLNSVCVDKVGGEGWGQGGAGQSARCPRGGAPVSCPAFPAHLPISLGSGSTPARAVKRDGAAGR